jgi:high-affinity Fe2+/Pb2+ permease
MSRTSAVVNSAILVFRKGLETILVLAAVTGAGQTYLRVSHRAEQDR